jgi:hypothetical protein
MSFAGAEVLRAEAVVTLLPITSPIPAGEWGFVPEELPRFPELLPLRKWGVRQNWYNGARYGAGFLSSAGVVGEGRVGVPRVHLLFHPAHMKVN